MSAKTTSFWTKSWDEDSYVEYERIAPPDIDIIDVPEELLEEPLPLGVVAILGDCEAGTPMTEADLDALFEAFCQ